MGVVALVAVCSREPILVPSLGSAVFTQIFSAREPSATSYSVGIGQVAGVVGGLFGVTIAFAASAPPFMGDHLLVHARAVAVVVAAIVTAALMILLGAASPAGGATALVLALGAETPDVAGAVRMLVGSRSRRGSARRRGWRCCARSADNCDRGVGPGASAARPSSHPPRRRAAVDLRPPTRGARRPRRRSSACRGRRRSPGRRACNMTRATQSLAARPGSQPSAGWRAPMCAQDTEFLRSTALYRCHCRATNGDRGFDREKAMGRADETRARRGRRGGGIVR